MQERRRLTRWRINKASKIKLEGAVVSADCLIRDINFKGLQIVLGLRFAVDTYIKFNLQLSENNFLECEAWVAWHRQSDGHNIYGLLFTRLTDKDKENIYKFVYNNVPQEISRHWWSDAIKEGGESMDDRRIFQRFNIRFPVKLLDLNSGQEVVAETSDISAKGIGVWSRDAIAQNTPLEAWLKIPDKGEPLYTRGNVVWSRPDSSGEYRLGIDLERADLMGLSRILRA
ncbi:MAG: PilZ domain protein [Candidatus Omnitrophica bacterium ADurb.Bin205]|nr:MAG: PilZ domain protein [Candidatus Omnitrophica bacterium ADurb.Bin205]